MGTPEEKAEKLAEFKALRATTKGSITRIKTLIAKNADTLAVEELECRLGILESYFKQFITVQANIDKICDVKDIPANANFMADIEEMYVSTKSVIMSSLKHKRPSMDSSLLNATASAVPTSRLQRQIKLPKFEGKYSEFPKFIAIFTKLVQNDQALDDCERFLILKESLGVKPLAAISDFDVTDENYLKALKRLKDNYDKKALMFEEHVSALFEIAKMKKSSSEQLRQIIDKVSAHLSAMLSLGNYENIANAMIIFLVTERLDVDSLVKWEEAVDYNKLSSWDECSIVLARRCQQLEARETKTNRDDFKITPVKEAIKNWKPKYNVNKQNLTSLAIGKSSCNLCHNGDHSLTQCQEFENKSARERYSVSRNLKLCIMCLKKGHRLKDCTAPKCEICNLPHHRMLHRFEVQNSSQHSPLSATVATTIPADSNQSALHTTLVNSSSVPEVLLETAIVFVKDKDGNLHTARVILDSASQINLICENMAQKLMLKKMSCALGANGIADISTNLTKKTQATLKSRFNNFEIDLQFYVLPKITGLKPDKFLDISSWNMPSNIDLADPKFNFPARVDMLLGAEVFLDLLSVGRIYLNEQLPRLQKTVFGWVVSGAARAINGCSTKVHNFLVNQNEGEQLSNLVEKFWQVEQIDMKTVFWTNEEEECERIFNQHIARDTNGRFIVKIPFTNEVQQLGDSFRIAERRFYSLERRLDKDPVTKEMYKQFIDEYIELGHMIAVEDNSKIKYFSPHQHIIRPESTSTKLRVVFDCSCKTSTGIALNEVMLKGPTVQDDLLSIILRFRCYKYAITADVAKMYRQAWVTEEDTYYQGILWRSSSDEKLRAYRLRTITYGTTSAPYLATRCLKKLGEDNAALIPLGSKKIVSDFYMDDLISGAETESELFEVYEQVSKIMNSAHFELRKWHSNCNKFMEKVPEAAREKPLRVNDSEIIKTLGIIWEPSADAFRYVWLEINLNKAITKRIVLAELSTLFDPLGLVNPVIVKGKIFMQDLWILKVNWDESLPMNLHSHWAEFRNKLKLVQNITVPRYVLSKNSRERVELHGFADASTRAYGCCLYVRCIDSNNGVTIRLWSAKSRVAPIKSKSLPCLELLAAELLSKLLVKTLVNFPVATDAVYLWSDSTVVLNWLRSHPSTWKTFVANRVASIQESTKSAVWRYVPTKLNPADIISRGAYADELQSSIWFSGPDFLNKYCSEWPANKFHTNVSEVDGERRTGAVSLHVERKENDVVKWIESHSKIQDVQMKIATLLNSVRNRKNKTKVTISVSLLDEALIRAIYCLQQHYFEAEFRSLKSNKELSANCKLKGLNLFIESSYGVDLVRVGGRLVNANLPYDAKHPILLPMGSNFVLCYIRHLHQKNLHAGNQAIMAILRQRFWVINARKIIRAVTSKCIQCFRCRPKLQEQIMGNLPNDRVRVAKPFTTTGVDFCGPVMITSKLRGVRLTKCYIAIFVCFASKAIHIEVVSDLTSKAFIGALKRFIARRGLCARLYCDNATNFIGAQRELNEFKEMFMEQQTQKSISQYCAANSIEFHHIPPRSPHFGGLWEAAVKSAKFHLIRSLGSFYLTFEELSTVTTEIEAILNSRPLTTMSNDPNDEAVLTPGHFLTGGPLVSISEPTFEQQNISCAQRWLRVTAIQQHFWKRWSVEYLHELQQRVKWTKKQRNIDEGDLVLVAEENIPSKQWLIGRITKVVADSSGIVRVVDIKTKNGTIRRAIQKVAPLPKAESDG